jgi:acetyl esterase/lipase
MALPVRGWAKGIRVVRNPLVSLFVTISLMLGNWLETCAGNAETPPKDQLAYGTDPVQTIDFWPAHNAPKAARRPAPLIMFVHGGAWSLGTKDNATGRAKIAHFTARGLAFATIGYRLVPGARVEDQAADLAQALAALLADADRLGVDRNRVLLMGHSAGAQLASLVGTDPHWLCDAGLTFNAIAGIIAIDGAAYDVPQQIRDAPLLLKPLYTQAFGRDPDRQRALSPALQAAAPNVANWLLLHVARADGTRQTETLAAALRRAGSTVDVVTLPGTGLSAHISSNRRLGDPAYAGTSCVDQWIDRILASRILPARRLAAV